MAYMSQERKQQLAPAIKAICKRHGIKATLAVSNHMALCLNIKSGKVDFGTNDRQINTYWYKDIYKDQPAALAFLSEVIPAMNEGNHNNSDAMIDYFDVGWYIHVNVGQWDKPYQLTA